jgi:hypothetical protein
LLSGFAIELLTDSGADCRPKSTPLRAPAARALAERGAAGRGAARAVRLGGRLTLCAAEVIRQRLDGRVTEEIDDGNLAPESVAQLQVRFDDE